MRLIVFSYDLVLHEYIALSTGRLCYRTMAYKALEALIGRLLQWWNAIPLEWRCAIGSQSSAWARLSCIPTLPYILYNYTYSSDESQRLQAEQRIVLHANNQHSAGVHRSTTRQSSVEKKASSFFFWQSYTVYCILDYMNVRTPQWCANCKNSTVFLWCLGATNTRTAVEVYVTVLVTCKYSILQDRWRLRLGSGQSHRPYRSTLLVRVKPVNPEVHTSSRATSARLKCPRVKIYASFER